MSEFDKVIGYTAIKQELMQISDMIKHKEKYEALGAKLPRGILIDGKPGYGKTLLSNCLIKESGLKAYTVRKTKSDFTQEITDAFNEAIANAPAIVFLDDMDKYADTDRYQCNCAEYVAVQSGIDACKGYDVLVIATVNKLYYLPDSLTRDGRFDRKYKLYLPNKDDSELIIKHYLSDKKLQFDINMNDVFKLFAKKSCADIEVILNDAAIRAAYAGRGLIGTQDIKEAFLRSYYNSPDYYVESDRRILYKIALHEAGHIVAAEVLNPHSVSIASICEKRVGDRGGFVCQYSDNKNAKDELLIGLAGEAAVELSFPDDYVEGCSNDLGKVYEQLQNMIKDEAYGGLDGFYPDYYRRPEMEYMPEEYKHYLDQSIKAEMKNCMREVRGILSTHKDLVFGFQYELMKKRTLLASDVQKVIAEWDRSVKENKEV